MTDEDQTAPSGGGGPGSAELPEQMKVRLHKADRLRAAGIDPYPVGYPRTHTIAQVRVQFGGLPTDSATGKTVGVVALTLGYGVMDCMLPSSWANCLDVGGRYAGAVSGAMNSIVQVGGFLSAILFGHMVGSAGDYNTPLFVIAPMLLIGAVLFSRIDPTQPLIPAAPPSVEEKIACA